MINSANLLSQILTHSPGWQEIHSNKQFLIRKQAGSTVVEEVKEKGRKKKLLFFLDLKTEQAGKTQDKTKKEI